MLLWAIFEGTSFLQLVFYPASASKYSIAGLDRGLFLFLAPFSPALLLVILYSHWIRAGVSLGLRYSIRMRSVAKLFHDALSPLARALRDSQVGQPVLRLNSRLFLLVSLALAAFVAAFPYRTDLNPGGVPVGLDAHLYINWLSQMVRRTSTDALGYAFTGPGPSSRPLLLILLYSASSLTGVQPPVLVESLPIFLSLGLAWSSYLFVRLGGGGKQMASLTAILTASSSAVTVGIWASYYANWLGLIEAYLFLGVLLSWVRLPSRRKQAMLVALSLALLFTHPWTWILIMTVAGGFVGSHWKSEKFKPLLHSFAAIVSVNVLVESVKTLAVSAFGAPAAGEYLISQTPTPFDNLLAIWPNVIQGVILTYDGLLATAIILGLALLYVIRLRWTDNFQRLLLAWVLVSSIPFCLLSAYFQTRIIYDLPIPVLAAGGLMLVLSRIESRGPLRTFLLLAIVLLSVSYALHAMTIV